MAKYNTGWCSFFCSSLLSFADIAMLGVESGDEVSHLQSNCFFLSSCGSGKRRSGNIPATEIISAKIALARERGGICVAFSAIVLDKTEASHVMCVFLRGIDGRRRPDTEGTEPLCLAVQDRLCV